MLFVCFPGGRHSMVGGELTLATTPSFRLQMLAKTSKVRPLCCLSWERRSVWRWIQMAAVVGFTHRAVGVFLTWIQCIRLPLRLLVTSTLRWIPACLKVWISTSLRLQQGYLQTQHPGHNYSMTRNLPLHSVSPPPHYSCHRPLSCMIHLPPHYIHHPSSAVHPSCADPLPCHCRLPRRVAHCTSPRPPPPTTSHSLYTSPPPPTACCPHHTSLPLFKSIACQSPSTVGYPPLATHPC